MPLLQAADGPTAAASQGDRSGRRSGRRDQLRSRGETANFANRSKITFPLLSDVDSKTIDAYDIRSPKAPPKLSGFARHATFILDQSGVIRAKLFRLSYQERSAVDALINALKEARTIKEASNIKPESTP